MKDKAKPNVNEAASALGKRSAEVRQQKWGKREFLKRMREYGKLGGRPNTHAGKAKTDWLIASTLRDQTHRELVSPPLQFHQRGQLFFGTHNEAFSVVAVRVSNPRSFALSTHRAERAATMRATSRVAAIRNCWQYAAATPTTPV